MFACLPLERYQLYRWPLVHALLCLDLEWYASAHSVSFVLLMLTNLLSWKYVGWGGGAPRNICNIYPDLYVKYSCKETSWKKKKKIHVSQKFLFWFWFCFVFWGSWYFNKALLTLKDFYLPSQEFVFSPPHGISSVGVEFAFYRWENWGLKRGRYKPQSQCNPPEGNQLYTASRWWKWQYHMYF